MRRGVRGIAGGPSSERVPKIRTIFWILSNYFLTVCWIIFNYLLTVFCILLSKLDCLSKIPRTPPPAGLASREARPRPCNRNHDLFQHPY